MLKVLSVTTQGKKKSLIMSTSLIMYPNSRVRKKKNKIQFVLCAYGHMYLYIQGIEKIWLRRGWQIIFLPEIWNAVFIGIPTHNLVLNSKRNFIQSDYLFRKLKYVTRLRSATLPFKTFQGCSTFNLTQMNMIRRYNVPQSKLVYI